MDRIRNRVFAFVLALVTMFSCAFPGPVRAAEQTPAGVSGMGEENGIKQEDTGEEVEAETTPQENSVDKDDGEESLGQEEGDEADPESPAEEESMEETAVEGETVSGEGTPERNEETPVSGEHETGEEEAETCRFALLFDSEGGTVSLVLSCDEGADESSPSYRLEKKDGCVFVTDRDGNTREAFQTGEEYALCFEAEAGTSVKIIAEASEGCRVEMFRVTGCPEELPEGGAGTESCSATATLDESGGEVVAEVSFALTGEDKGQDNDNEERPAFDYVEDAGGTIVKIHAESGVLPAGCTAEVRELKSREAAALVSRAQAMSGGAAVVAAVDITFRDRDGKEIQPDGLVQVSFTDAAVYDEVTVYHAEGGDAEKMEEVRSVTDGRDVVIESGSFSPFILLAAASEPDWTQGGAGTKKASSIRIICRNREDYVYFSQGRDYGDWITLTYEMFDGSGKRVGNGRSVCMDPKLDGGPAEDVWASAVYEFNAPMLVKALYYSNVAADVYRNSHDGSYNAGGVNILMHVAAAEIYARLGYAYKSSAGDGFSGGNSHLENDVKTYVSRLNGLSVPDGFYFYAAQYPGKTQDFGFVAHSLGTGSVTLRKVSANPSVTDGNSCYSLAGATFDVCKDAACTDVVGTLTTGEDGTANTIKDLPLGTYYLKETAAPRGYNIHTEVPLQSVTISESGAAAVFQVSDEPALDPVNFQIDKANRLDETQEGRSLAGTVFEVKYYDGYYTAEDLPGSAVRTWYLTTVRRANGLFRADFRDATGDEVYRTAAGTAGFPLGTIVVTEKEAAPGYENDADFGGEGSLIVQFLVDEEGKKQRNVIQGVANVTNSAITADTADTPLSPEIGTAAQDRDTGTRLSLAGKELTILDTVTCRNLIPGGRYTLSGRLVDKASGETLKDADGEEVTAEKTFTASGEIEEQVVLTFSFRTDGSFEGKTLVAFEVLSSGDPRLIGASHEDLNDEGQTIHIPRLGTSVMDAETKIRNTLAAGERTIIDTVSYENLIPGEEYTVKGVLTDKETGEPVTAGGEEVTGSAVFTADSESGTVQVEFSLDATGLENRDLVAYEELYINGKLIGEHKNPEDEEQTIHVPDVYTTAADSLTMKQNSLAGPDSVIEDTVFYKNLIPGETYTITGKVMDKESGEELDKALYHQTDENGNETDGYEFSPSARDGSVVIRFRVDASALAGKDVVVFEDVLHDGKEVAVHADINDEPQTIHYPEGHTLALDTKTGIKNALAEENTVFEDTFTYKNLIPGETYRITGKVMNKETGEAIPSVMTDRDGNPVGAGFFELVPEEKDGETRLYFRINASDLENTDAVVFERVSLSGSPVIIHEDLGDESQTMYIPEGRTTAVDSETNTQLSLADGEVTVIDTFTYKNLIPGKEYTVTGRVMDKETAREIPSEITGAEFAQTEDGSSISFTGEKVTFVPAAGGGALKISFLFDGSGLAGEDVVLFERAYHNGREVIIHENIDDESQTVHIPDGKTLASDPETGSRTMEALGDITVRDVFRYENLMPGKEYTVTAKVMLKPAEGDGGGEEIEAQLTDAEGNPLNEYRFTPGSKNGSETLYFKVDASAFAGRSIVFFERVRYEGVDIIIHEDLEDEDETIHFPDGYTTAVDSKTQDHIANADRTVEILDELVYKNLIPGKTYTVKGILMDKETGQPVADAQGNQVTAETEFIPETEDGSTVISFVFDGSGLGGHSTVAFETVYSEGKQVFAHADLGDEDQTVSFPSVRTNATDKSDGDKKFSHSGTVTVNDRVDCRNLVPGKTYRVSGTLMDKRTGKPAVSGGKVIVGETVFTAESADVSIDVAFTFKASDLREGEYVVFEDLFVINPDTKEAVVVGSHKDISDEAQMVTRMPNPPETPLTGDDTPVLPLAAAMAASLAGIGGITAYKKKNRR